MAVVTKTIYGIGELEEIMLNNKECFYYDVFDCKQGKSILKVDAREKDYIAKTWTEEKVLTDIKSRISNEDLKTFNISKIMHVDDLAILDIFIHAEYECNVGGETHLDIYIKMYWNKDYKTIL